MRAYAKPEMEIVGLKAEEAVLTACKTWSSNGQGAYMGGSFGGFGDCQRIEGPATRCNIVGS